MTAKLAPGTSRTRALALVCAALATAGAAAAGCEQKECIVTDDCAVGFDCTLDGVCVSTAQGQIRWISPEPGSVVGARFDAVVEVSFRAPAATVSIDRDAVNAGERCAPFVPTEVTVIGDLQEALVQQVTLPGLFALGESFGVAATLNAAGGTRSVRVELQGEPTGYGGIDIDIADADEDDSASVRDAASTLSLPIDARFDRASARALVSVEPLGSAGSAGSGSDEPTPREVIGGGIAEITDVRVPLARGPQVLWVDSEDEQGTHRCGLGISGIDPQGEAPAGVELGLSFEGAEPGQLDLRVLVEDAGGDSQACTFNEPGARCEAVYETRAPARSGEEVLLVPAGSGGSGGVLTVAVVPGAAGPSMTARVRVSSNGVHVGWLGPYPLQPALGETWIAGRIVLDGSLARLERVDQVTIGAPF